MLNDVRFETDTTTDFDDRVHRWRAMNLDHDLVDELAWAAPRVKDKRLIISPQVEEVDNWQERISAMIECVMRLPEYTDSRWVTRGKTAQRLLSSIGVGYEILLDKVWANPKGRRYYVYGAKRLSKEMLRWLSICGTLISPMLVLHK